MGLAPAASLSTYAAVIDLLPVAAFMANPDGTIVYCSAGWERMTGYPASVGTSTDFVAHVHGADRDLVRDLWALAIASGSPFRAEYRMRFADGAYRWTLGRALPMHDDDGNLIAWFGTVADTQDLHNVEEAMANAIGASLESARDADARARFVERLLRSSDDCVNVLGLDGSVISMNSHGRRAFGFAGDVIPSGRDWASLWAPEHRDAARAAVAAALHAGRGRFEAPLRGHDGIAWWDVSITPILSDTGEPENLLAVAREMTEIVLAHRELAASEARYRVLSEALPGVTFTATPDGKFDYMSPGAFGSSGTEALGDGWKDAIHPGDRARVEAAWQHAIETGEPYEIQKRARTADGTYRWMLTRALPQRDDAGAIVRWIGVGVDVDDQHRADENREQFVRLADASDEFVAMATLDGTITYVNDAFLRALEADSEEDVIGRNRLELFSREDRELFRSTIAPAELREGRWTGELRLETAKSATNIPIFHNTFLLRDDAGKPAGLASVSRDLRERRRLEIGMRALAETGAAMYGSLDFDGTIRNVAGAVVRSFASLCVVDAVNADGSLRSVAASNRGQPYAQIMEAAAVARRWKEDHPIWRAIRRGESTLVATIPRDWPTHNGLRDAVGDAIDDLDVRSMLVVPIRSQQIGGVYGALSCMLDGFDERKHFSVDDLRFAEEIAIRAGLAFDHARAYERERRIAVTLQDASLPRTLPMAGDLHLSADYRPGSSEATIGGDWYDAFVLDDGRVAITIGDVLGNGLSAAVTMGKVRQAMQAVATILPEPGAMLDVADRVVRAQSDDAYATAIAGIFDPQRSTFTFASAGHPGPIVRRPTHEIEDRTNGGLLLGMRVSGSIETTSIDVEPGSTLVFFTDGLTEATRDIDEGLRRIIAAMSDPAVDRDDDPAHALVERVLAGAVATDDIAVLVAEIGPHPRLADRPRKERERSRDLHATALGMFPEPLAASDSRCTVLTVQSRLRDIAYARRAVKSLAKNADVPRDLADVLELATGELVANAVEHGSGVWIDVGLSITAGGAELIVTNDGPVFERSTAKLSEMILAERGRGLAILDALGFRVAVERDPFDRCCVTASLGRS